MTTEVKWVDNVPYVTCYHCDGEGWVKHKCKGHNLRKVISKYSRHAYLSSESLGIYVCDVCKRLWMIRHQWDDGTGSDDIWLLPGESKRGYAFTREDEEEARKILAGEGES